MPIFQWLDDLVHELLLATAFRRDRRLWRLPSVQVPPITEAEIDAALCRR